MLIDLPKLSKSVRAAINGLKQAYSKEQNFRIELLALTSVCILGVFYKINFTEWVWTLLSAFLVLTAELLNTAIERLTDLVVDKRKTALARQAKDVAAAAVLLTVLQAALAGMCIFVPKMLRL